LQPSDSQPRFNFAGHRAIVTGGCRGIGRAIADALADSGAEVDVFDVDEPQSGVEFPHRFARVSVTDAAAVSQAVAGLPTPASMLVNNAGITRDRSLQKMSDVEWASVLSVNLTGAFNMMRAVAPAMVAAGFGRIVNITSLSVKMPVAGLDLSSGARAGLTAFVAGVARGVADRNVTINNLLPGYFDTERLRASFKASAQRAGKSVDAITAQWQASVPARRFGTATEFGQTCAFLCSVHAGFITGQNILMDGGLYPSAF